MVYKISWESGWLPWQPNLAQKMHSSVLCKKSGNLAYRLYDGDFGAVEFQYAIRIFKGAKGVAMATKFEQK